MEDLQKRLDEYRRKRALNTSIAVMMYILGAALLIGLAIFSPVYGGEIGVILLLVIAAVATGLIVYTHMSIPQDLVQFFDEDHPDYPGNINNGMRNDMGGNTNTNTEFNSAGNGYADNANNGTERIDARNGTGYYGCGTAESRRNRYVYKNGVFASVMKLYWLIVTIVYLGISFATMAWHITWIIWLIGVAVEQAIKIIYSISTDRSI